MVIGIGLVWSSIGVKTGEESGLSTTVVALTVVRNALYMIQSLYAKIILLRYKRLRKAIALIREVEAYLIEEIPHHHYKKDYIVFRTIVGLVLGFLSVYRSMCHLRKSHISRKLIIFLLLKFSIKVGLLGVASLRLLDSFIDTTNKWLVAFVLVFQSTFMILVLWTVLLLHLSHYIIAHLIELLGKSVSGLKSDSNR